MDRIINVKVNGNHLTKDGKNAGTRGEANVTTLRIAFDEGWRVYGKAVIFWDAHGMNPTRRILTTDLLENAYESTLIYLVPIPPEALGLAGELTFTIEGYVNGKRQRAISDTLEVKDALITDVPSDVSADEVLQMQAQYEAIMADIQNTMKYRDEAVTSALNSKLHEESAKESAKSAEEAAKSAENAVGKTSYIGANGNWYAWDSIKEVFYDTGVRAQAVQADYGQNNETNPDFIKNRPFHEEETVLLNVTENIENIKYYFTEIPSELELVYLTITIADGTTVNKMFHFKPGILISEYNASDWRLIFVNHYDCIHVTAAVGVTSFSISRKRVFQIDEKFIPDTIARKDDPVPYNNSKSGLVSDNVQDALDEVIAGVTDVFASCAISNKVAGITAGMAVSGIFPLKFDSWSVSLGDSMLASALGPEDEFVTAPGIFQNEGITVTFYVGTLQIITELKIINKHGNIQWGILKFKEFAE